MKEGKWWQRMQFVTAILGALCWVVAIALCCCYKKLIIAMILSSQRLEEFELIKTISPGADSAPTLPPHIGPILTLFPPEADDEDIPLTPQQITSIITTLIVVVVCLLAFTLCIWKRCRYVSNVMKSCFAWFLISTYHRGIAKADIFLEVTRISGAKSTWALYDC